MKKKKRHTLGHFLIVLLLHWTKRLPLTVICAGMVFVGYLLYYRLFSPFNFIIAFFLVSVGVSMFLVQLWEMWAVLINKDYNRTHCPFCRWSTDPKKILSEKNGREEG